MGVYALTMWKVGQNGGRREEGGAEGGKSKKVGGRVQGASKDEQKREFTVLPGFETTIPRKNAAGWRTCRLHGFGLLLSLFSWVHPSESLWQAKVQRRSVHQSTSLHAKHLPVSSITI